TVSDVSCNIIGNTVSCTGALSGSTMSAQGVYAGVATTYGVIQMVGTDGAYIYFTAPTVYYKGRLFYVNASNTFNWRVGGVIATVMQLSSANLQVNGTVVSTSDNIFKFNEKPLTNALDVINRLEPVEYDESQDLVGQYTAGTPQSHQCVFIAQSVQSIDELKGAVVGGQVGDDGKESIRALNYNVVFTYAVKQAIE
ncbi:MAG: hypothetical protein ACKPKO_18230, partial [Candidatus Fonsibacter sp.]